MGRITPSVRQRVTETMKMLRRKYRAAFKDDLMQAAFDELWKAWASELAAMINSDLYSVGDMLILTGAVDNRRELEGMRRELEGLSQSVKAARSGATEG